MKIVVYFLSITIYLLSLILVFFAPLVGDPLVLKLLVGIIVCLQLFIFYHIDYLLNIDKRILLLFVLFLQPLAIFMPLFMSDDALRHMHDGYFLWRGVDVYSIAPQDLPDLLEVLPNHPHLGSIYLPSTQIISVIGSLISVGYGYYIVFHLMVFVLVLALAHFENSNLVLVLLASPWLVLTFSGHHFDVLGWLIVSVFYLEMQQKPADRKYSRFFSFTFGLSMAFLGALKPEGLIWALFLLFMARLHSSYRFGYFLTGFVFTASILVIFAFGMMWKSVPSFLSFLKTAQLYLTWFLAYNPVPDIIMYVGQTDQLTAIQISRIIVLILLGLVFGLVIFLKRFQNPKNQPETTSYRICQNRSLRGTGRLICLFVLMASVLNKGTWQPWYFLWFLPFMTQSKKAFIGYGYLTMGMVLFYIPVIDYRKNGVWDMKEFYILMAIFTAILFMFRWYVSKKRPIHLEGLENRWK